MKIWKVPFSELDDKRLLGQHREIHMLHGLLSNNPNMEWGGYHATLNHYEIHDIHYRTINEMHARGFVSGINHKTYFPRDCPGLHVNQRPKPHNEPYKIDADRRLLVERWRAVGHTRFAGRSTKVPAVYEGLFSAEPCIHDGPTERLTDWSPGKWELCLICKAATRVDNSPWKLGEYVAT